MLLPEVPKALPEKPSAPAVGTLPKPQKTPTLMPPTRRGARFGPPPANDLPEPALEKPPKPARVKNPKVKNDPKLVAAARELRDRWLERVNADPSGLTSAGLFYQSPCLPGARQRMRARLSFVRAACRDSVSHPSSPCRIASTSNP